MPRHLPQSLTCSVIAAMLSVGAWGSAFGADLREVVCEQPDRAAQLTEVSLRAYVAEVNQFLKSDSAIPPPSFLQRDAEWLDSATRALTQVAVHGGSQAPVVNVQGMILLNLSAAIDPQVERGARERYLVRASWVIDAASSQLPRSFQRRSALGVIWFWQGRRAISAVIDALDGALERFGEDAELLLAQGTLWENIAALRDVDRPAATPNKAVDRIVTSPGFDMHPRHVWMSTRKIYEQCASTFERALERSPDLDEARVRLAHVQLALNRYAEAAGTITPALNSPAVDKGNPVPYLAALLHGRAMLGLEQPDAARSSMTRALTYCPDCQTARIALSQALQASGDRRAAENSVRQALGQGARDIGTDPWWEYPAGQAWRLPALISEMVREARR